MKKVLAMILALVLGLSLLAGCTNSGNETPTTKEAGGETQEAGGETQETAAPAENGLPLTEEKQELLDMCIQSVYHGALPVLSSSCLHCRLSDSSPCQQLSACPIHLGTDAGNSNWLPTCHPL